MRDEYLIFGKPLIGQDEIDEVVDSLRSGWIGTGPKVERFERMLEAYIGAKHVRCVSSCTAALYLAMTAYDIGPGDEVILPAMTFVASANAVEHVGARPILVDSDRESGLLDLNAVEEAISDRTKAIMPVHFAGRPVDLDQLGELADRHGLHVIEDAAHAIGTEWRGRKIGAHGNLAAFSFYVTKNITTIEGGAIATDDPVIAERIQRLALHGLSTDAWRRFSDTGHKHYEVVKPGFKFNMTDIQAAIGIHQLPKLDRWIQQRTALSDRYDRLLCDLPVTIPAATSDAMRHSHHLYQVLVDDDARLSRDQVLEHLHRNKVGAGVHYRGIHLHPYYRDRYDITPKCFPVATDISNRTVSLPLSPLVDQRDQDDVANILAEALI